MLIAACKTVLEVAPSASARNRVDYFAQHGGSLCAPAAPLKAEREDVKLVHAPERIIPGNMVYELLHNNRTIGADDPEVGEEVAKIYATFCQAKSV